MASISLWSLCVGVCVFLFVRQSTAFITCYNCTSTAPNDNCATLQDTTSIPVAQNCTSCQTTYSVNYITNTGTFSRACYAYASTSCSGNYCYCQSGNNCNSAPAAHLGVLSCYVCTSANMINNGCEDTVDPNSMYVTKTTGCVACGTQITYSAGYPTSYNRYGIMAGISSNGCLGSASGTRNVDCRCSTDYCNSASALTLNNSTDSGNTVEPTVDTVSSDATVKFPDEGSSAFFRRPHPVLVLLGAIGVFLFCNN